MNLRVRNIILIVFFLIFITISPILVLYSLGYKYNFAKNTLEKTGVFFIKSFPKNSSVILDNQTVKNTTPTQATRLLPKIYNVKIIKDGYQPWEKNLEIYPQTTTFIEDVSLIYQKFSLQNLLSGQSFEQLLPSDDKNHLALIEKTENSKIFWLFNTLNESFIDLYRTDLDDDLEIISWSNNNRKILFNHNGQYLVISADTSKTIHSLSKMTDLDLNNLKWDNFNDNIIYTLNNQTLFKINYLEQSVEQVSKHSILNYLPYGQSFVVITLEEENYYLRNLNLGEDNIIFSLPYSSDYVFRLTGPKEISLFDKNQGQLYLIDPADQSQPITAVFKNVLDYSWHGRQLIYWNQTELWAAYPETGDKHLLERTGNNIYKAFWHPNAVYIFAIIGDDLKFYELDSRDRRNNYTLFNLPLTDQKEQIFTNRKGDELYLITSQDNQVGFYKVKIQ